MSDRGPLPSPSSRGRLLSAGLPGPSPALRPSQPAGSREPVPGDKPDFVCSGPQPSPEERPLSRAVKDSSSPHPESLTLCADAWHPGVGLGGRPVGHPSRVQVE